MASGASSMLTASWYCIPELTPRILHEFVEKIVIHAATDPHSKINRRQEVDIYYKGIGILEMSKVFDSR